MTKLYKFTLLVLCASLFVQCKKAEEEVVPTPTITKTELGKLIFQSTKLSNPEGQSCATCHDPASGFADPDHSAISPGINPGMFGNRNAPTVTYTMYNPSFHLEDSKYLGGQFWDGRANTLEDQAKGPFFNPLEMNLTDKAMFVTKLKSTSFYAQFVKIYGESSDEQKILDNAADAIATFERSAEVNPFTSKYDFYLKGEVTLTAQEEKGMKLFKGKGLCASCHLTSEDPSSKKVLFTDFKYHNIGVPKNPSNPFYTMSKSVNPDGANWVDLGLGGVLKNTKHNGEFRCATIRNCELTAPYFHNGVYKTLKEVVHFYNSRAVDATIGKPETAENLNTDEVGDLGMTSEEEDAVVAFMLTLTDGYKK